jgi:hypothetical protein
VSERSYRSDPVWLAWQALYCAPLSPVESPEDALLRRNDAALAMCEIETRHERRQRP